MNPKSSSNTGSAAEVTRGEGGRVRSYGEKQQGTDKGWKEEESLGKREKGREGGREGARELVEWELQGEARPPPNSTRAQDDACTQAEPTLSHLSQSYDALHCLRGRQAQTLTCKP